MSYLYGKPQVALVISALLGEIKELARVEGKSVDSPTYANAQERAEARDAVVANIILAGDVVAMMVADAEVEL